MFQNLIRRARRRARSNPPRRLPRQHRPIRVAIVGAATVFPAFLVLLPHDASAAEVVFVDTTADVLDPDDGLTSLREAVIAASDATADTTISLTADSTYVLSRCGEVKVASEASEGDLDLASPYDVTIIGTGATITTECEGERLLDVTESDAVVIRDVTFRGGTGYYDGGAIRLSDVGSVSMERVSVLDTRTTARGDCDTKCLAAGAVYAVLLDELTLVDSTIADNTATLTDCTAACWAVGGLAVDQVAAVTIERSLLVNNVADVGAACADLCAAIAGGADISAEEVRVDASTFAFNRATAPECPGCSATGGLELDATATAAVVNSTFTDNVAAAYDETGGLHHLGGSLTLTDVTLADNSTDGRRSRISNFVQETKEPLTIVATAIGSGSGPSGCRFGTIAVAGYGNVESADECGLDGDVNRIGVGDLRLLPADAPTWTRPPAAGSPLLDVTDDDCELDVDQLGTRRPVGDGCDAGAIEALTGRTRFVALSPQRLFDTRAGERSPGPKGFVNAGESIDVTVTGAGGIPLDGVSAVVLNVTATEAAAPGFVTVWPTGGRRPLASSINLTRAGQTRANLVTVPVGDGGRITLYASHGAHLLADVAGYYAEARTPVAAGRLVPVVPSRVFDTRRDEAAPGPKGFVAAGGVVEVQIAGRGLVPASGAGAVVLNITATAAARPGYVSAWPAGWEQPSTSVVNLPDAGSTASNLVMLPLGDDGRIRIFSSGGAHLLADVTAYVTGDGAAVSTHGLFVPLTPTRVFDTRAGEPAPGPKGAVGAGSTVRTTIAGTGGVPADAAAVLLNLTATDVAGPGFVTTWPTGLDRPLASTLNPTAGDTRANATLVRLGTGGRLDHFSLTRTHLLADVAGYVVA